ncbi:MAG: DUF1858 domain-containing protein [Oscillospiraceae bacterium]|nr:DUF1858 domain-containing protein [Oscillospiraceae bacterium]
MLVTKDSVITDILEEDIDTAEYFFEMGMYCIGCPSSFGETLEQACAVHGMDPEDLVNALNDHFARKGAAQSSAQSSPAV